MDSNIIISAKYNFNGGALKSLKQYCDGGAATLYASDIVINEINKHIEGDAQIVARQAKNAVRQGVIYNALGDKVCEKIEKVILSSPQRLLDSFKRYIKNAIKIKYNDISVIDLFNDYFSNREPFESAKEKKSEFPDAAIIASIKKRVNSKSINGTLYVITDDNGWHQALKGVKDVVVYKSLKEVLDEISKEQKQLYETIINYATENIAKVKSKVEDWLCFFDWTTEIERNSYIECDEIIDTEVEVKKLKVESVDYINNKDGYADVTLSGYANIKVEFDYIDHLEEIYDKEDKVWFNTKYGNGRAIISIPLELLVCILLPNKEDEGFSLGDIDYDYIPLQFAELEDCELFERNEGWDYWENYSEDEYL